jgi:Transposase DDE domain group 1
MIWLLRPDQLKTTEFAPAMDDSTGVLPGLSPVNGKPVHVAFDGGQMTSDAGILLLAAIEQRLGIAERLADCIEDPRAPERVRHGLAEMIRYRALLIAAGYPRACPGEGRGQRLRCAEVRSGLQDGGRAAA